MGEPSRAEAERAAASGAGSASAADRQVRIPTGDAERRGTVTVLLEYVTFGHGLDHLLEVALIQFVALFLDVGLLDLTAAATDPGGRPLLVWTWVGASALFLLVLAGLVREIGRRTLAPRFHRTPHQVVSALGYLMASGLSFAFGYVTLVVPTREFDAFALPSLAPGWLLTLVFATFIAIGYHAQVDAADYPRREAIVDTVSSWLDALDWVEAEPNTLARKRGLAEFRDRTDELAELLARAKTVEGRRLAADVRTWRQQFESHSSLSREMVLRGEVGGGRLDSPRLESEHEQFRSIRRRLATIAEVDDR